MRLLSQDTHEKLKAILDLYDNPKSVDPESCQVTEGLTELAHCDDPEVAQLAEEGRQLWAAFGVTDPLMHPRLNQYRWNGFFMCMEKLREIKMAEQVTWNS